MKISNYRSYTHFQIPSDHTIEIICDLIITPTENSIIDCHGITNARLSIDELITEWTKRKSKSKDANKIEDKIIDINIELTGRVDGNPITKNFDITNKLPGNYEGQLNLERLIDLNGFSFSNEKELNKELEFSDPENLKFTIATKNLSAFQIGIIHFLMKQNDRLRLSRINIL
jgi:hypothetical protein